MPSDSLQGMSDQVPFHSLLEAIDQAIIATHPDGKIIYWNQFAEELYGWPAVEVLGRNISNITVPENAGAHAGEIMASVNAGKSWTGNFVVKRRDGSQFTASVTLAPIFDEHRALIGVVGVSNDVAARQQLHEKTQRDSEEEFRTLANSLPELCWMARGDGHIFWYNERWYEYTGTTPEQMEGWGWQTVHDPNILPAVLERWKHCISTGEPFEMKFPLLGADRQLRWFLTRVRPVRDKNRQILRWFGVNTNIDEELKTRQEILQAREELEKRVQERTSELNGANENLRELSGRLLQMRDEEGRRLARELHDSVGQLVAALGMNLGVVNAQAHKLDATAVRALAETETLLGEISREIRTISHLLHPPLLEEAGLASALNWYVSGFSERSKIAVDLKIPSTLNRLPQEMEITIFRIVQEALTNIHRHSGSPTATITILQEKKRFVVKVQDQGKGIPHEKQSQIKTTAQSGVGFRGMKERVRQISGTLEIHSDASGTIVMAALPVADKS